MPTEILISSDPWENRVAILEDEKLAEYYVEREEKIIGSIFKGKVQNVLPGMGASFVDIGLGRNAFLYVDDINKTPLNIGDVEVTQGRSGFTINEKVSRGDDVLVQIVKEPRGLKGARVSTNISLPGRYLILMPTGKYSGVSRKVESAAERDRLKKIVQRIRPEGMATVVRTAAAGVSDAELIADLGVLLRMWHGIVEIYNRAPSPSLLHKDMNLVYKAARDFITPEIARVYIDDAEETDKVRDFMRLLGPQYIDRIEAYKGGKKLFADFKIDEELTRLMRPKVNLPSGGSLVIETTEAFTVIDVNSGKFTGGKNLEDTILRTNVEAAAEIARQVRLRDIGGIIVCDFIDMRRESSRNAVIEMLEKGLRKDRTRSTIQSFSALGLLEFTRKRVGKDLSQQLRSACPTCVGLGSVLSPETVAIDTFRKIRDVGHSHAPSGGARSVQVLSSPGVAAQLDFWYEDEMTQLAQEIGARVDVRVDASVHPEKPRILTNGKIAPAPPTTVRVGDEIDVDVLVGRLPNPTSALAVVDGRLVEIENAANATGSTLRIKIIDIDEDSILAEARAPVAGPSDSEDRKKRRRRGGRGRKRELTPTEQAEELRELAEEAARGAGARTAAIGISTQAEADSEEVQVRTEGAQAAQLEAQAQAANVVGVAEAAPYAGSLTAEEDAGRKRRRRRRRRRPGVDDAATTTPQTAAATVSADDEEDDGEEALGSPALAPSDGTSEDPATRKRRRRRRRGRGRGGAGVGTGEQGAPGTTPDRHIFRVDGEGAAHATGQTAPQEPSRAIARVERRPHPPAIEAPPPSLVAPSEDIKTARPTRRRPNAPGARSAGTLTSSPQTALPAPVDAPKRRGRPPKAAAATAVVAEAAPKRRGRPPKAVEVVAEAAPKRRGRPPKAATVAASASVPSGEPKRRGRPPKAATATVSPAAVRKATAPAKKSAVKKASAKKSTAKKSVAKKATTTARGRKKS